MTDTPRSVEHAGLSGAEAARRLDQHGPNALPEAKRVGFATRFVRQFRSPLIYILLFALAFEVGAWIYEGLVGSPLEAIAIFVTLLLNAALGSIQEHRSEAALARLEALAAPATWVIRDARAQRVSASQLVPGDIIRLEAGDRVPADARLVARTTLLLDESILTGESVPVERGPRDTVHSGTLVVRGQGLAEVTKTGIASAMGRLAHLLAGLELGQTPLERRIDKLGRRLARAIILLSLGLIVLGVLAEGTAHLPSLILVAVALGVAAVPEELPAVLTLTLALGVERMAKKKALVRRLSAVEALGSVTVIATDKTGTLTENQLRVESLEATDEGAALLAMTLANDGDLASEAGDPLDLAFLRHARGRGVDVATARAAHARVSERPFDSAWKYTRVTVRTPEGDRSYLKGAAEVIIARCAMDEAQRARWLARAQEHAANGHKVLALATGVGEQEDVLDLLGLVALRDPPRSEVPEAIQQAQEAGIRVVMITGDHPATALSIARSVGIREPRVLTGAQFDALGESEKREVARTISVFARVSPEHKLALVGALKDDGEVVAMTGDGVNDAPALKKADVGIAMGNRGSDVTREVASIVLLDDNFATIVHAIEEGRSLYENIQKFMRFMFSMSLGFLVLILGGAIGSWALDLRLENGELLLPLTALQILWINFLADGPPAFALGLDRNPDLLQRPPRDPAAPLLDAANVRFILAAGVINAAAGLAFLLLLPALGYDVLTTQAAIFAFGLLAQLSLAQPARELTTKALPNPAFRWTLILGIVVQVAIFLIPPVRATLGLSAIDPRIGLLLAIAIVVSFLLAKALLPWCRRALARSDPSAVTPHA